jgi:hypothetical protein
MKNGTIINVFGEPIEVLASSSATNYGFVTGLQTSAPGGPPPHRHLGEDEVFTASSEFFDGESWVPFHRGEAKYSVRGSYHGFRSIGRSAGKSYDKCRRLGRVLRRDFFASTAGGHGMLSGDQQVLSVRVGSCFRCALEPYCVAQRVGLSEDR